MTAARGEWVVLRRRVSLGGCVSRGDGQPVSEGIVRLAVAGTAPAATATAAPARRARARNEPQASGTPAPAASAAPVREAPIRRDGRYFYLDLPPGDYTVEARDERGLACEPRSVTVPPADRGAWPPLMAVHLTMAVARDPP